METSGNEALNELLASAEEQEPRMGQWMQPVESEGRYFGIIHINIEATFQLVVVVVVEGMQHAKCSSSASLEAHMNARAPLLRSSARCERGLSSSSSFPPSMLSIGVTIVSRGRKMRTRSAESASSLPEEEEDERLRLLRSLRKSLRKPRGGLDSDADSLRREQKRRAGLIVGLRGGGVLCGKLDSERKRGEFVWRQSRGDRWGKSRETSAVACDTSLLAALFHTQHNQRK